MNTTLRSKKIAAFIIILFAGAIGFALYSFLIIPSGNSVTEKQSSTVTKNPSPSQLPANSFDSSAFSLTEPSSIWVVVNKKRPLTPQNYVPADLVTPDLAKRSNITGDEQQIRSGTAAELQRMFDAAKAEGINLNIQSGYRSYNFQSNLYGRYVREQGQATADTQSARPGHSEHQTGLAVDIGGTTNPSCNIAECFKDTVEGKWAAANAYKYGFIIRYPSNKTSITGYTYEPWHLRYVGTELAREMHDKNTETLEEFFKLPAAPDYN